MRLLIVTDSHGYGMQSAMEGIEVYPVVLGRTSAEIRGKYRQESAAIRHFDPSIILFHMGHNDVLRHPVCNTHPLFITSVYHMQLELVQECLTDYPAAKMVVSSMLPRVAGPRFTADEAKKYNRIAKRYGQMILRGSRLDYAPAYVSSLNRRMLGRISRAEAHANYFELLPCYHFINRV
jgi:hypothetical protein